MRGRELLDFGDLFQKDDGKSDFTFPVFLILSTSSALERWALMAEEMRRVGFAQNTKIILNRYPCDIHEKPCEIVDAINASHLFAIREAMKAGTDAVILEDDMYFKDFDGDVIENMRLEMHLNNVPAGFMGGIYTSMAATDTPKVYKGRILQAHAYFANPFHPAWAILEDDNACPMNDVRLYNESESVMIHPAIAFQRQFPNNAPHKWPLACLPIDITLMNAVYTAMGNNNCYEMCTRRTNHITALTGSLRMSVLSIIVVSLIMLNMLRRNYYS